MGPLHGVNPTTRITKRRRRRPIKSCRVFRKGLTEHRKLHFKTNPKKNRRAKPTCYLHCKRNLLVCWHAQTFWLISHSKLILKASYAMINGAAQPLLLDPKSHTKKKCFTPIRRRYRRCRSAPLAECVPAEVNGNGLLPHCQSIFHNLHPSFKKVAICLVVYLGLGTVCFYLVRPHINGKKTNNGVLDAVYFCIVTMTTVGYGDLVPNSVPTKLLACAFVFIGMALAGLILSKAADYLVEKQEIIMVKAFHISEKINQAEILKEIETNKVRYKCFVVFFLLMVLVVVGTIFLMTVEKLDLVDAFYCVCSTITTLGYGDKSFSTKAGRAFAVFWILTSTICLAQFFLYVAELNTESRQMSLANWVLNRRITNLDLEAADLDDDEVVGAAEFIIYKLKEMGKIDEEDISLVMKAFEELDVDQSGTLSASDIRLAQSSETGN